MTKREWAECATILATFYPHNFKLGDGAGDDEAAQHRAKGQMMLWFQALADLPGERVKAAVWSMVRTQPAFPSVADIRRLAEGQADAAAEAWHRALMLSRHYAAPEHQPFRTYGSKLFVKDGKLHRESDGKPCAEELDLKAEDPVLMKTITAMGGLARMAFGTQNTETLRAQFLKIYAGFAAERQRQATYTALGVDATPLSLSPGQAAERPSSLAELVGTFAPTPTTHQEDKTP